jgi:hypothetical protein
MRGGISSFQARGRGGAITVLSAATDGSAQSRVPCEGAWIFVGHGAGAPLSSVKGESAETARGPAGRSPDDHQTERGRHVCDPTLRGTRDVERALGACHRDPIYRAGRPLSQEFAHQRQRLQRQFFLWRMAATVEYREA